MMEASKKPLPDLCGCGKPIRYYVEVDGELAGSCNKYFRCSPVKDPVALEVWFGSMPESNGRENWTVMLCRKHAASELDKLTSGFSICRSEYKDRMRYEADCLRFLIGEIEESPDILSYDSDLHSGFVEPSTTTDAKPVARLESHVSDRPYSEGQEFFNVVILDRDAAKDGLELFSTPQQNKLI